MWRSFQDKNKTISALESNFIGLSYKCPVDWGRPDGTRYRYDFFIFDIFSSGYGNGFQVYNVLWDTKKARQKSMLPYTILYLPEIYPSPSSPTQEVLHPRNVCGRNKLELPPVSPY